MTIYHSCCPGKTNINPPEFKQQGDPIQIPHKRAQLITLQCEGCRTEIHLVLPPDGV